MSIGSVPANSTKAGAVEFVLNMDTLVWETTQVTSWWPGAGAFVPGTSVATSFDLWFKFKPPIKYADYYTTVGVTVWNKGGAGYFPSGVTDASLAFVTSEFDTGGDYQDLLADNGAGRGQFHTNVNKDNYYYIKVKTPNQNRVPETLMKIRVDTFIRKISVTGAIVVQDESTTRGAIVVANPVVNIGPNGNVDIAQIWTSEDGHSIGGRGGDVLLSGFTCIQDAVVGGVTVRSRNYRDPVSFAVGIVNVISSNSGRNVFLFPIQQPDSTVGPAQVRSVTVGAGGTGTANLGSVYSLPIHSSFGSGGGYITNNIVALRLHYNTLYYSFQQSNTVYRWDLLSNQAMPVFIAEQDPDAGNNPNYFGMVSDILVAQNGDVFVGFHNAQNPGNTFPPFGVYKPFTIRRYNSAGVFLASYFNFNVNPPAHYKMNYSEDSNLFYVWAHQTSSGYPSSMFYKVRFSDGTIDHWISAHEFVEGAMQYTGSLYSGAGNPAQSWGTNQTFNFWINPLDTAIPPIPLDPPVEPLPGEPPNPVGGGLLMLDPSNPVRHDVYMDKTGLPYNSTIVVTIGTAFVGD